MKHSFSLLAVVSASFFFGAVAAQPPQQEGWSLEIGAGALYSPNYDGDDDYRLSLLPNIRVTHGERFFASVQDGLGYTVINRQSLRAGPIARVRFSRDAGGSKPIAIAGELTTDLIGLRDVATTAELGGFVEYDVGPLTASAEARQGVNGHEGFVADLALTYGDRNFALGPPVIFSFGPRMRFADSNYVSAYFDVTPVEAAASGLPVYDGGGGLYSYGIGGALILPVKRDNSISAVLVAGYDRLAGDAGDAPLVRLRGSRNQASLGLFFTYRLF